MRQGAVAQAEALYAQALTEPCRAAPPASQRAEAYWAWRRLSSRWARCRAAKRPTRGLEVDLGFALPRRLADFARLTLSLWRRRDSDALPDASERQLLGDVSDAAYSATESHLWSGNLLQASAATLRIRAGRQVSLIPSAWPASSASPASSPAWCRCGRSAPRGSSAPFSCCPPASRFPLRRQHLSHADDHLDEPGDLAAARRFADQGISTLDASARQPCSRSA